MYFSPPRQLHSDADTSRLDDHKDVGNSAGLIDFITDFNYLRAIDHLHLNSDEDVDKRFRPASTFFWALWNILTIKHDDLTGK
jgi:hypothetical protein